MPIPSNAIENEANKTPKVYVSGDVFGIKMYSDGALIIDTQEVETENGKNSPADDAGLIPGDIIITANGKYIDSAETLKKEISHGNNEIIKLKIKREEKYISKEIKPTTDKNGIKRLGIWVKDSAAGLGTISFYSKNGESFVALGHGICDRETGVLIPLSEGEIVKAVVTSVNKSQTSKIGTLNGYFTDETIGKAISNKTNGIYGVCTSNASGKLMEIASPGEIAKGHAQIYCNINDNTPRAYDVTIVKIDENKDTKNMIIQITDNEMLEKTGGIVQGMSGSPIIQNGKVAGVLTHVLTDDVTKGYAIFAETMYNISCNIN